MLYDLKERDEKINMAKVKWRGTAADGTQLFSAERTQFAIIKPDADQKN